MAEENVEDARPEDPAEKPDDGSSKSDKEAAEAAAKKAKLKEEMIEVVRDCGDRSSVHGCPSLASKTTHWSIKLVWIAIACVSWGYLIYLVRNSFVTYYSYGVTTSSSIVQEAPTLFPAVDICNLNPLNSAQYAAISGNLSEVLDYFNVTVEGSDSIVSYVDDVVTWASIISEDSIYAAGFTLTKMLVSCQYNGQKCSAKDFFWYYDYYYGNCYTFNGGLKYTYDQNNSDYSYTAVSVKKAFKPGWRSGLRLELYSPTDLPYSYKSGFRVIIHNQSTPVFPDEDGIDVPVGFQANLAVSRTFVNRLSSPYSDCIDEFDQATASKNRALQKVYDQIQSGMIYQYLASYCFKVCYQLYIIDTCSCASINYYFLSLSDTSCINKTQVNCSQQAETTFYAGDLVNSCYASCPQTCSSIAYDIETSLADYPTTWYATAFNTYKSLFSLASIYLNGSSAASTSITYDMIKQTTAMINVYYDSLEYTQVGETAAYSFDQLVASLGGNMGLFTGMSLLSFVELIELVLSILFLFVCAKKAQ